MGLLQKNRVNIEKFCVRFDWDTKIFKFLCEARKLELLQLTCKWRITPISTKQNNVTSI